MCAKKRKGGKRGGKGERGGGETRICAPTDKEEKKRLFAPPFTKKKTNLDFAPPTTKKKKTLDFALPPAE